MYFYYICSLLISLKTQLEKSKYLCDDKKDQNFKETKYKYEACSVSFTLPTYIHCM